MLLIHYWNNTYFQNQIIPIEIFLKVQIIFYFIDLLHTIFIFWLNFRAKQFHSNFNNILAFLLVIHFLDSCVVILIKLMMVSELIDDQDPENLPLFVIFQSSTLFFVGTVMTGVPLFVFERFLASYYIADYENEKRYHITGVAISILIMFGILTSMALQNQENTGIVIFILCSLNGLSLIEMSFLRDWNCKKHEIVENSYHQYSLAERFQISENIKALTMLKNLILYMGTMNCLVLLSLYLKSISFSVEYDLLATLLLEACFFIYAFSFPHVTAKNCPRWERLLYRYLKRIRKVTFLKDSFGRKMDNQASNIDVYFNGLKVAWN